MQLVLPFQLLSDAPCRLHYRASGRNAAGTTTIVVDVVSQDDAPLGIITMARVRDKGFVGCLTSLTQLGTILEKALMCLTFLSTSQSTYSNHRVILLSTCVMEILEICLYALDKFLVLQQHQRAG
jgi:hypothetical protein